ncbi:hypothetical protein [Haloactinopolyspora sp.]|uniref:hypothetical protein n=1 Tax=Haloactinopolyspora sp. TaxID=1966353 RepID=UPI002610E138|nr:hypothetical protein [Haloactinopolyspora sp.]
MTASGPWRLVESLTRWAEATPWCDWLELGGSLGRGAGDADSDVDAGVGVELADASYLERRDAALAAARTFAPVADELVQHLGSDERPADHLVMQYTDGRQLSLVVMAAQNRPGLPPGSRALLDRTGRLAEPYVPDVATAKPERQREWAFLAWWALTDVAKHAKRGSVWRAVESLHEARTHAWRLHAARADLDYPAFGVISVENAAAAVPTEMGATLPAADPSSIIAAAVRLSRVLDRLTESAGVAGVRAEALRRLRKSN